MKIKYAALFAAVAVALTACEGSNPDPVRGNRDDIKHVEQKTEKVKEKRYKRECTMRVKGICKRRSRVYKGTVTVTKVVRPERWCVELDNAYGRSTSDDVWFTVSQGTYLKAASLDEGDRMKFTPLHQGCS